jgi:hypothetical protein
MSDHIPTLADVCSAIAEGRLSAAFDGSTYQVSALELRRFFSANYSLPAISSLNALSPACSETVDWSSYKLCRSGL